MIGSTANANGDSRMRPSTGRSAVSTHTRIRNLAGLLGFALGSVYTLQTASAFNRQPLLGTLFITIACGQVMYGLSLLLQPWVSDSIGRARRDAAHRGRRWYLAGIVGNVVLIVLLGSSLAWMAAPLSIAMMEMLTLALETLVVACLAALVRMSEPSAHAR